MSREETQVGTWNNFCAAFESGKGYLEAELSLRDLKTVRMLEFGN